MFDFTWSDHTIGNVLYCAVIYLLFVLLFYKKYVKYALYQEHKSNQWLMLTALILIITACIDGDWFHYREMVHNYDFIAGAYNHGEPVYAFIISFVKKNYLLFRIFVWGGAFVLTFFTFKRFEINVNTAVFFIIVLFLVKFNYSRATLGMSSYFLGLSFLLKPIKRKKMLSFIVAAFLMLLAYDFHHSMITLVVLTIVAYLPMDKPFVVIIMLLLLPIVSSVLHNNLFLIDQWENEYLSDKFSHYIERETGPSNMLGIIGGIIGYGVFVIPLFLNTIVVFKNNRLIETPMKRLFRIVLSTSVLAFAFALMKLDSTIFIYRILYMTYIPLTILTVYFYEKGFVKLKQYSLIVFWGVFAISFKLLHLIYQYH